MKHVFTVLLVAALAFVLVAGDDSNITSEEDIDNRNEPLPAAESAGPKAADGAIELDEPANKGKRSIPMGRWVLENHAALTRDSDELPPKEEEIKIDAPKIEHEALPIPGEP